MDKNPIALNFIPVKSCKEFGIIDNKPCELIYENKDKWHVVCACNKRTDFKFLSIDNNGELELLFKTLRKGKTIKKCDCCLSTEDKFGFIEIKSKHKGTFQEAVEQLKASIKVFGENNLLINKKKYAFVCTDALTSSSHHTEMSEFWNEYKTHLYTKETKKGEFISEL